MKRAIRDRIRALFLDSKNSYSLESAAALLNLPLTRLEEESRSGAIATYRFRGKVRVRWEELASYALSRWSLVSIAAALSGDLWLAMPPLTIPRFSTDPDSFLASHLQDMASAYAEEMEAEFPGFIEAMHWPESFTAPKK